MLRKLLSPRRIRTLHRWSGLIFSLFVLASAGSGVIHTIMSRTTPPPPPAKPSSGALAIDQIRIGLPDVFEKLKLTGDKVRAVNLRQIESIPWYQIFTDGNSQPTYASAVNGELGESMDEAHAEEIASGFLGIPHPIRTAYLTRFDGEYGAIFRILPVYRYEKGDALGTRVYVSTTTGSVTMATNDARAAESKLFSMAHKWMFIRDKDIRDLALVVAMAGIMLVAIGGVVLFVVTRPRRRINTGPVLNAGSVEP